MKAIDRRIFYWEILFIVLAGTVLYMPALKHFYFADDYAWLEAAHRASHDTGYLLRYRLFGYWRPAITLSFALEYLFFNDSSLAHHLTNIILHIISSILVYLILRRLIKERIAVLFGAALFVISPAGNEAVIWVSGRTDVLCAVFFLAALYLYFRTSAFSFIVFFLVACALLAKELAVVWPVVVLAMAREGEPVGAYLRRTLPGLLPYVLLIAVILSVHGITAGNIPGSYPESAPPRTFSGWVLNVAGGTVYSLFPVNHLYRWDRHGIVIIALFIFLGCSFAMRKQYRLLQCLFITVVLVAPAALTPYRFLPEPWLTFRRFFYLPAFGACIFWASFMDSWPGRKTGRNTLVLIILALVIGIASYSTVHELRSWSYLYSEQFNLMMPVRNELKNIPGNRRVTVLCPDKQAWPEQLKFFAGRDITVITDVEGYKPSADETVYLFTGGELMRIHPSGNK